MIAEVGIFFLVLCAVILVPLLVVILDKYGKMSDAIKRLWEAQADADQRQCELELKVDRLAKAAGFTYKKQPSYAKFVKEEQEK